jgi:hypothetical protein
MQYYWLGKGSLAQELSGKQFCAGVLSGSFQDSLLSFEFQDALGGQVNFRVSD